MENELVWLPVPDVAERLGVPPSRVRELLRDRHLLAVRRGESEAWHIPELFLVDGEDGLEPLPTLRGTLILLGDAGLGDDAAMEWLLTENDELRASPIEALRSGKKAPVRRAAQTLF